jgi:hypothetical protein
MARIAAAPETELIVVRTVLVQTIGRISDKFKNWFEVHRACAFSIGSRRHATYTIIFMLGFFSPRAANRIIGPVLDGMMIRPGR